MIWKLIWRAWSCTEKKKKTNISGKHPRGIRETGFLKNVKQFFRCVEPIKINKGSL